ncbi:MAG: hypothetical protein ACJ8FP_14660 [Xanthobacteraceae bacterium]
MSEIEAKAMAKGDATVGKRASAASEVVIAGCGLLMLLAAQWIACSVIPGSNYYALDGKMMQSVVLTAFKFGAYFDVTNLNPVQGVGSQLLPKNVWANPAFWPFAFFDKETATDVSALVALACFASAAYIMMRCFDLPVLPSVVAAQSCILLFAPTVLFVLMPANFCPTPGDAVVYAPYMIALGLLARVPPDSWPTFALTMAGITALIFYSVYCDPLWTMIAAISWGVPFAVVTFSELRLKTILIRGAALGCCLALLVLTGAAAYLYTVSRHTQRVYFADSLDRVRVPELVSALTFASGNMRTFYLVCAVGWLLGLLTLRDRSRVLVIAASTAFILWVVYSVVFLLLNIAWLLPVPLYLEHCLFVLYSAGAVAGFWGALRTIAAGAGAGLIRRIGTPVRRSIPAFPPAKSVEVQGAPRSAGLRHGAIVLAILCVTIFPAQLVRYTLSLNDQVKATVTDTRWADEPELLQFLKENIGLDVGQPFRGRINFLDYDPATLSSVAALWSSGVPTINEYSQLAIPPALYFIHVLFKRNVSALPNHFNLFWSDGIYSPAYWGVAQMFGARYSAERIPLPDEIPGTNPITKPHRPLQSFPQFDTWYIYELPRPNIGDYSPTEVIAARSGAQIMSILSQPDFDFTSRAVLTRPLDKPLVPAREMRLSIIRGGLHVSGKSDGTSLVILPQQFSHCLRAHDSRVRFVRANLMMAGLVFSGDIDTDIVFDYGIFSPACRRADLADLKELDLKIDLRMPHLAGDRLFPDWNDAVARLRTAVDAIR